MGDSPWHKIIMARSSGLSVGSSSQSLLQFFLSSESTTSTSTPTTGDKSRAEHDDASVPCKEAAMTLKTSIVILLPLYLISLSAAKINF